MVAGLQQCPGAARKIGWEAKSSLSEQLEDTNDAVSKTLEHDEGTLLYRAARDHWRQLQAHAVDYGNDPSGVGLELRKFVTKRPTTAIAHSVSSWRTVAMKVFRACAEYVRWPPLRVRDIAFGTIHLFLARRGTSAVSASGCI